MIIIVLINRNSIVRYIGIVIRFDELFGKNLIINMEECELFFFKFFNVVLFNYYYMNIYVKVCFCIYRYVSICYFNLFDL